jgi:hypothetical protein
MQLKPAIEVRAMAIRKNRENERSRKAETNLSESDLARFLGVNINLPSTPQPDVPHNYAGWICDNLAPIRGLVGKFFPFDTGHASLRLDEAPWWCVRHETTDDSVYRAIIQAQLVVRGWTSRVQQLPLPPIPIPSEGRLIWGNRKIDSYDELLAWYQKVMDKHARGVQKRLTYLDTMSDAEVSVLFPHDIWTKDCGS